MKAIYIIFTIIICSHTVLAKSFVCKSDLVVVSVDGEFDQMTFTGDMNSTGSISNLSVKYARLIERNIYTYDCSYNLSITDDRSGSVSLFCPGIYSDREYISTSEIACEVKN